MGRRAVLAFLAFVMTALSAAGNGASVPDDLARAVADYDRAQVQGDGAALQRLLADDYRLVDSRGRTQDKRSTIADATAPGFRLEPYTVSDETIHLWFDGAVFAGQVELRGVNDGQPFAGTLRFADVWRRNPNGWQVVFTEATRVAP